MALDAVFYEIYGGLPRGGPGDDASTRRALRRMEGLPDRPRILDLGCGPGKQTLELARGGADVVALDNFPTYLERLARDSREAGLEDRIRCVEGDMAALPFEDGSFDVVWSEGSIFVVGFEGGLRDWRRLLRSPGWVAVSEMVWLASDPPGEVREFLEGEYPAIAGIEENEKRAARAGYQVEEVFVLPEDIWWTSYYGPLEARLALFAGRPDARDVVEAARQEIEMYRRHADSYGYAFFILRPRAS